jgi:hypothetical protein
MAEGENLADFKPTIGAEERIIEPEGALTEAVTAGPVQTEDTGSGDALPSETEGGEA